MSRIGLKLGALSVVTGLLAVAASHDAGAAPPAATAAAPIAAPVVTAASTVPPTYLMRNTTPNWDDATTSIFNVTTSSTLNPNLPGPPAGAQILRAPTYVTFQFGSGLTSNLYSLLFTPRPLNALSITSSFTLFSYDGISRTPTSVLSGISPAIQSIDLPELDVGTTGPVNLYARLVVQPIGMSGQPAWATPAPHTAPFTPVAPAPGTKPILGSSFAIQIGATTLSDVTHVSSVSLTNDGSGHFAGPEMLLVTVDAPILGYLSKPGVNAANSPLTLSYESSDGTPVFVLSGIVDYFDNQVVTAPAVAGGRGTYRLRFRLHLDPTVAAKVRS